MTDSFSSMARAFQRVAQDGPAKRFPTISERVLPKSKGAGVMAFGCALALFLYEVSPQLDSLAFLEHRTAGAVPNSQASTGDVQMHRTVLHLIASHTAAITLASTAISQTTVAPSRVMGLPASTSGGTHSANVFPGANQVSFRADGSWWVVIGLPYADPFGTSDGGMIRTIRFNAGGSISTTDLYAPTISGSALFGSTIATDGNTLVASAAGTGATYVYRRSGSQWVLDQSLPTTLAGWGGNVVVGGKIFVAEPGASSSAGQVLVFTKTGSAWSLERTLTAPQPLANFNFGGGIAAGSNTLVVSEFVSPVAGCTGRCFVYNPTNLGAAPTQLAAPIGLSGCALFGCGAAATDTTIAIRARDDSANGSTSGSVVVYEKVNGVWTQNLRSGPSASVSDREWGLAAVSGGRMVVVGEKDYVPASLFERPGSSWGASRILVRPSGSNGMFVGKMVDEDTVGLILTDGSDAALALYPASDCDGDGIGNNLAISSGISTDSNADGIPDSCQILCPGDLNGSGSVDGADIGALLAFWGPTGSILPQADINHDGIVNGADLGLVLTYWGPCPH